ncbi:hypothetical protein I4F81_002916 [Pyropia yezoensis]|uniref:Uncharacterized protein n=1 Tax=Pyropia yezoensis TaxID=2788 RepID=A0ACC3BR05_PYRYE|nr:hypothetical protein I4F81_002916 [Neopyropia yezoensis]
MSASLRGADAAAIAARYGVPATAAVVVATRATAVALQFPDAFLADAPAVAAALSAAAAAEAAAATTAAAPAVEGAPAAAPLFYILGDSSHSPCCVDGIAAAHVNADLLVHYGEACLSAAPPLPVAYVFPPPAASVGRPARAVAIVDAAARLLRATTGVLSVVVTADLAAVDDAPGGSVALRNAMLRYRASPFYYLCPVLSPRVADDVAAVAAVTERVASVGLSAGDAAPVHPPFSSSADGLPPPTRASVGRLLSRRLRALGAATPGRRYGVLSSTAPGAGGRGALAAALSAVRASGRSAVGVAVGVPTVAKLSNFPDVAAWVGLDCPSGGGVAAVAPDLGVPVLTAGELAVLLTAEADAADADADDGLGDMADGGPPAEPVDADVVLASAPWVAGVAEAVAPLVAVAARRWGRDVAAAVEEAAAAANGGVVD